MTCIVAVQNGDSVIVGGDTLGSAGYRSMHRRDPKVFRCGNLVMGFTSSYRMGQLLRFGLEPQQAPKRGTERWMVTHFVPACRTVLKDGGYAKVENAVESGGTFIVATGKNLFVVEDDFQVGLPRDHYTAVGCGEETANGSLFSTKGYPAEDRVKLALEAASHHSGAVGPPFTFLETKA